MSVSNYFHGTGVIYVAPKAPSSSLIIAIKRESPPYPGCQTAMSLSLSYYPTNDPTIPWRPSVPSQPTDLKAEAKSETSILLSWVPPPQNGQDNQIIGYELLYRKGDEKDEVTLALLFIHPP